MPLQRRTTVLVLLLLALHLAHVGEEIVGRLFLIDKLGGLVSFIAVNAFFLAVILALIAASWRGRRWSITGLRIWAIVETINGAGHIVATRLDWFERLSTPGWISGIGLLIVGPLLLLSLPKRAVENREPGGEDVLG